MNNQNKKYYLNEMHFFKVDNACFIFLPCSLLFFEVDSNTFDETKQLYIKYGPNNPMDFCDSDILSSGIAYMSEEEQNDMIKKRYQAGNKRETVEDEFIPISSTVLQIANDCNLNCIYCYGDGGSYGRKRELMTFETARKAIDLMVKNKGEQRTLVVVFFGGEPLINFGVVKATRDYCRNIEESTGIEFKYSMTTNGTILTDEIYDFIKDNNVSVMISMDGGAELQDTHRCYCNGKGSFNDIKKNIKRFKEARGGYLTARATVCSTDIRFKKIADDLLALGFTNAVTSMVDTSEDSPLFIGGAYTERVLEQYRILADDYIRKMKNNEHIYNTLFSSILDKLYYKKMRIRSCNAGNGGIAVGTDGNIYPCHRFMGMPEFIIGNLEKGIDEELRGKYRESTIYNKEGCKDCWARYLCSGGCAHTSAAHCGDIFHAPDCYCDIYRGLYEILLYAYWNLKNWDDDIFRKMLDKSEKQSTTI